MLSRENARLLRYIQHGHFIWRLVQFLPLMPLYFTPAKLFSELPHVFNIHVTWRIWMLIRLCDKKTRQIRVGGETTGRWWILLRVPRQFLRDYGDILSNNWNSCFFPRETSESDNLWRVIIFWRLKRLETGLKLNNFNESNFI